eukprot:scaffold19751_cov53-Cyclotella_meneghiniana.AAC.4
MRRKLLMGAICCTNAYCHALLSPNSNGHFQPYGLCYNGSASVDFRLNHCRASALMAAPSSDDEPKMKQPTASARRKRTVRVSTSKQTKIPMKKRTTVTIKSPNISSLNSKRKSATTPDAKASINEQVDIDAPPPPPIKIPNNLASGATFQRLEMIEHTLLTKEEEFELGTSVVKARELREKVENYVEELKLRALHDEEDDTEEGGKGTSNGEEVDMDFLSYELDYLSLYGFRPGEKEDYDLEDDLLIEHAQHRSQHLRQLKYGSMDSSFFSTDTKRTGYRNGSSSSTAASNSYTPLLHIPIHQLSDQDLVSLGVPGGKSEAIDILLDGAHAREVLMRRNVKLVVSIAKSWMRNSYSTENANLGAKKKQMSNIFDGSWDRPSLDEAVQEGVLGLARAVDKYDPERGLKFSTRAVTGCLRVPSQLHDIKAAYKRIVKDHIQESRTQPAMKAIAKELGITEQRLNTAIRATSALVPIDAPLVMPGSGTYKGSAAGDGGTNQELSILDTLRCFEKVLSQNQKIKLKSHS